MSIMDWIGNISAGIVIFVGGLCVVAFGLLIFLVILKLLFGVLNR